jgi:hypothetical protein
MLDLLFALSFIVPAPFWFLLIFFPTRPFVKRLFGTSYFHVGFAILGGLYLFSLVGTITSEIGAGSLSLGNLTSLDGLTALMSNRASVLVVWLHVVTMDLAGAFYIYRTALDTNMGRAALSITLLFTLLLGPVGMLMFAIGRILYGMRQRMEAAKLQ